MRILTTFGSRTRRGLEPTEHRGAQPSAERASADRSRRGVAVTPPPPTAGQLAARRHRVRLVVEDLETGERVVIVETESWRSIEVLGSAALYYAAHYDNPQRPLDQVRARRGQANQLGAAIWDVAEATVGIEAP